MALPSRMRPVVFYTIDELIDGEQLVPTFDQFAIGLLVAMTIVVIGQLVVGR